MIPKIKELKIGLGIYYKSGRVSNTMANVPLSQFVAANCDLSLQA